MTVSFANKKDGKGYVGIKACNIKKKRKWEKQIGIKYILVS